MASTADFKNGMCIEMDGDLYQLIYFQHVKPGKGGAFVRTKLRNINTGRVQEKTFNSGEKVKTARVEKRPFQYLYADDQGYVFMNQENFEQVTIPEKLIDAPEFLSEGQEVTITYHDETETPIACELPQYIELEVTYAEPGVKGDTATNTQKTVKLSSGAEIQVPLFIEEGENIKIDPRSRTYIERVKKK